MSRNAKPFSLSSRVSVRETKDSNVFILFEGEESDYSAMYDLMLIESESVSGSHNFSLDKHISVNITSTSPNLIKKVSAIDVNGGSYVILGEVGRDLFAIHVNATGKIITNIILQSLNNTVNWIIFNDLLSVGSSILVVGSMNRLADNNERNATNCFLGIFHNNLTLRAFHEFRNGYCEGRTVVESKSLETFFYLANIWNDENDFHDIRVSNPHIMYMQNSTRHIFNRTLVAKLKIDWSIYNVEILRITSYDSGIGNTLRFDSENSRYILSGQKISSKQEIFMVMLDSKNGFNGCHMKFEMKEESISSFDITSMISDLITTSSSTPTYELYFCTDFKDFSGYPSFFNTDGFELETIDVEIYDEMVHSECHTCGGLFNSESDQTCSYYGYCESQDTCACYDSDNFEPDNESFVCIPKTSMNASEGFFTGFSLGGLDYDVSFDSHEGKRLQIGISAGGVIIVGNTRSACKNNTSENFGENDNFCGYFVKTDFSGNLIWSRSLEFYADNTTSFHKTTTSVIYGMTVGKGRFINHVFIYGGVVLDPSKGTFDAFMLLVDSSDGSTVGKVILGSKLSSEDEVVHDLIQLSDGTLALAGYTTDATLIDSTTGKVFVVIMEVTESSLLVDQDYYFNTMADGKASRTNDDNDNTVLGIRYTYGFVFVKANFVFIAQSTVIGSKNGGIYIVEVVPGEIYVLYDSMFTTGDKEAIVLYRFNTSTMEVLEQSGLKTDEIDNLELTSKPKVFNNSLFFTINREGNYPTRARFCRYPINESLVEEGSIPPRMCFGIDNFKKEVRMFDIIVVKDHFVVTGSWKFNHNKDDETIFDHYALIIRVDKNLTNYKLFKVFSMKGRSAGLSLVALDPENSNEFVVAGIHQQIFDYDESKSKIVFEDANTFMFKFGGESAQNCEFLEMTLKELEEMAVDEYPSIPIFEWIDYEVAYEVDTWVYEDANDFFEMKSDCLWKTVQPEESSYTCEGTPHVNSAFFDISLERDYRYNHYSYPKLENCEAGFAGEFDDSGTSTRIYLFENTESSVQLYYRTKHSYYINSTSQTLFTVVDKSGVMEIGSRQYDGNVGFTIEKMNFLETFYDGFLSWVDYDVKTDRYFILIYDDFTSPNVSGYEIVVVEKETLNFERTGWVNTENYMHLSTMFVLEGKMIILFRNRTNFVYFDPDTSDSDDDFFSNTTRLFGEMEIPFDLTTECDQFDSNVESHMVQKIDYEYSFEKYTFLMGSYVGLVWKITLDVDRLTSDVMNPGSTSKCELIYAHDVERVVEEIVPDILRPTEIVYISLSARRYEMNREWMYFQHRGGSCSVWRVDLSMEYGLENRTIQLSNCDNIQSTLTGRIIQRSDFQGAESGRVVLFFESYQWSMRKWWMNRMSRATVHKIVESFDESGNSIFNEITNPYGWRDGLLFTVYDQGVWVSFFPDNEDTYSDSGRRYFEQGAFLRMNGADLDTLDLVRGNLQYCVSGFYMFRTNRKGTSNLVCLECGKTDSTSLEYTHNEFSVEYSTTFEVDSTACTFCNFKEYLDTSSNVVDRCRACDRLEYNPERTVDTCTPCPNYLLFDFESDPSAQEYVDHCFQCLEEEEDSTEDSFCAKKEFSYQTTPYPPVAAFTRDKLVEDFLSYQFYFDDIGIVSYVYIHDECRYLSHIDIVQMRLAKNNVSGEYSFETVNTISKVFDSTNHPFFRRTCGYCGERLKQEKLFRKYFEKISTTYDGTRFVFFADWECYPTDKFHVITNVDGLGKPAVVIIFDVRTLEITEQTYETSPIPELVEDYDQERITSVLAGEDFYVLYHGFAKRIYPDIDPPINITDFCDSGTDEIRSFLMLEYPSNQTLSHLPEQRKLIMWYSSNNIYFISDLSPEHHILVNESVCTRLNVSQSPNDEIVKFEVDKNNSSVIYIVIVNHLEEKCALLRSDLFDLVSVLEGKLEEGGNTTLFEKVGEIAECNGLSSIHRESEDIVVWGGYQYSDSGTNYQLKIQEVFNLQGEEELPKDRMMKTLTVTDSQDVLFAPLNFLTHGTEFLEDGKILHEYGVSLSCFLDDGKRCKGLSLKRFDLMYCALGFYPIKLSSGFVCFKQCWGGNTTSGYDKFDCSPCPNGTFLDESFNGDHKCFPCPPGYYTPDDEGYTECIPCPRGTYSEFELGGSNKCLPCPAGTYQDQIGQSSNDSCQPCGYGYYSSVPQLTDRDQCQVCDPGFYGVLEVSREFEEGCRKCPIGTYGIYSNSSGKSSDYCKECPKGTYNDEYNATSCKPCLLGRFSERRGNVAHSDCQKCSRGTYNDHNPKATHFSECIPCEEGYFSDTLGSVNRSVCRKCDETEEFCGRGSGMPVKLSDHTVLLSQNSQPESTATVKIESFSVINGPEDVADGNLEIRPDFWYKLVVFLVMLLSGIATVHILQCLSFSCCCGRQICLEKLDCCFNSAHDAEEYESKMKIHTWYGGCLSVTATMMVVGLFVWLLIDFFGKYNKIEFSSVKPGLGEKSSGLYTLPSYFGVETFLFGSFSECNFTTTSEGFVVRSERKYCEFDSSFGCKCYWQCYGCYFKTANPRLISKFETDGYYLHLVQTRILLPHYEYEYQDQDHDLEDLKLFEINGYVLEKASSLKSVVMDLACYKTEYSKVTMESLFAQLIGMVSNEVSQGMMGSVLGVKREVYSDVTESEVSFEVNFLLNSLVYFLEEEYNQGFLALFSQIGALSSIVITFIGCLIFPWCETLCFKIGYDPKRKKKKEEYLKKKKEEYNNVTESGVYYFLYRCCGHCTILLRVLDFFRNRKKVAEEVVLSDDGSSDNDEDDNSEKNGKKGYGYDEDISLKKSDFDDDDDDEEEEEEGDTDFSSEEEDSEEYEEESEGEPGVDRFSPDISEVEEVEGNRAKKNEAIMESTEEEDLVTPIGKRKRSFETPGNTTASESSTGSVILFQAVKNEPVFIDTGDTDSSYDESD